MSGRAIGARCVSGRDVAPLEVEGAVARALKTIGSGVFLPLFSLPSYFDDLPADRREYGLGDTGPSAREFVRRLASAGQRFWALLPLGPTDDRNCPYRTDSSFAVNLNTVSPDDLIRDGWITERAVDDLLPRIADSKRVPVGNAAVFQYRRQLLSAAYERLAAKGDWRDRFEAFTHDEAEWLDDYAVYKTIEQTFPIRWSEWPAELRDAEPAAIERFSRAHADDVRREKFYQFIAQHYFLQLREFAEARGVRLVGDSPAYSMHGSADVWANRDVFELDDRGQRTVVAGAPPDAFDANGQAWNHPMYRWDEPATVRFLKKKLARWHRLLGDGLLREDHIIGKITPWGYRFGTPASTGWRVKGRYLGNALFDALLGEFAALPQFLIGEDLGTVTDETKWLMEHYRFMGMKVVQFIDFQHGPRAIERDPHAPGNYPDHNVLFLGTHDTPLVRPWYRHTLGTRGRQQLANYLGSALNGEQHVTDANVAVALAEVAMRRGPQMVIHQMADLVVGDDGSRGLLDARMNDPGLGSDNDRWRENWSWRLAPDAFDQDTVALLRRLTEASDRTPERAIRRYAALLPVDEAVRLAVAMLRDSAPRGAAEAERLESMVRNGFARRVPLTAGILSAVYQPVDGTVYLLLSDHKEVGEYASPLQTAVSIIRAWEALRRCEDNGWTSPLEELSDQMLAQRARAQSVRFEDELQCLVAVSSDEVREAMITLAGSLLDPDARPDDATIARLRQMNVSRSERAELGRRCERTWTRIWLAYEARGMSRENIVDGILTGDLHGCRVTLRELRWCLAEAFAPECALATNARDRRWKSISDWSDSLGPTAVETVLFACGQLENADDCDVDRLAGGVSGLLSMIRKARRMQQHPNECREQFFDGAAELVRTAGAESPHSDGLVALLDQLRQGTGVRELEAVLEMVERRLIARLAQLAPRVVDRPDPGYPAQIDLQMHSDHSDCGWQSVARVVYEARRRGLKTIAITDHQSLDGVPEAIEVGRLFGVEVIPAVELYTGIRRDDGIVHDRRDVLVYFPDGERFLAWYERGLDDDTWTIFNDGWNRSVDGRQWGDVPIKRATDWARARGGVPVLAHPALLSIERFHREGWSFEAFERFILETGLAGIEISHPRLPFEENTVRFVPLIREFNRRHPSDPIVFTLGTDAHTTEDIGRANLDERTVAFVAGELAPGDDPPASLRRSIVRQLKAAAARITSRMPLYKLKDEILRSVYPGTDPFNRPLTVICPDGTAQHAKIVAGIKLFENRPVIVAVNRGRCERYKGKDWGSVDVAEFLGEAVGDQERYRLRDLLTGETHDRTRADLVTNGLHIGLLPNATQFLAPNG